jgi:hypothetical protein
VATRTFPNEFFSAGQLIHTSSQVPEKYKLEESHFNSFYEISPNASPLPAFRAGNFLINDTMNRIIFVLDKNLGKELWRISYERLGYKTAHDVTLLPNGNLLIFVNRQASGPPLSSIDEVSPADGRLISRRSEPGGFYARYCGSAQPREGGALLYAAEKNGKTMVKVLSAAGKLIFSLDLYPYFGRFVQGAYERRELEGFLSEAARP